MKKALITGITGQDGSYLAESLLGKDYEVHGLVRHSTRTNTANIDHLLQDPAVLDKRLFLHMADLGDQASLFRIVKRIRPTEIYNLAAQSHVHVSFEIPEYTAEITGMGTIRLLEAIVKSGVDARFYQASSSEMFGKVAESPQTEKTPFHPRSPYACAKIFSHWITVNYREAYDFHASSGICFNHESPRRGDTFVTRKITRAVARILAKKQEFLKLGNLEARRDWGYAKDYVEAMWLMLQQSEADDYVIATGETHSIKEFLEEAFGFVGLNWNEYVKLDPALIRPSEVDLLVGDASKAAKKLGWKPSVTFKELVRIMMVADLEAEGIQEFSSSGKSWAA